MTKRIAKKIVRVELTSPYFRHTRAQHRRAIRHLAHLGPKWNPGLVRVPGPA